jgi:predicted naringenin-chalcone synthase
LRTSYLGRIGTAVPVHAYDQMHLYEAMTRVLPLEPKQSKALKGLYKHSGIGTRHSVLPDFLPASLPASASETHAEALYPQDVEGAFPPLSARMVVYNKASLPLALAAIRNADMPLDKITHIIAVSCTGLAAPGLDLMLLRALELPVHTHRTCVHYMGCYAALHGLKQADSICRADPEAHVLLVCVELCTLHFQPDTSWDNLTSSLLFADGAAAVMVTGKAPAAPALQMRHFYSEVALEGWDEMSWNPDEKGFLMRLGRGVPFMLQNHSQPLIARALERAQLSLNDVHHWAIHPGGRLILDLLIRELKLAPGALDVARQVLQDYGNMSSPTILFVLKALQQTPGAHENVFAAAFGPGLTMETALLRWQGA